MKIKTSIASLSLFGLWYLLVSSISNPPVANTGGAGQTSCAKSGCHDSPNTPGYSGAVAISGVPNPVAASTAYTVVLTAASNAVVGGFQLMCLDGTGAKCGTLANIAGAGTSVATGGSGATLKQYVRHNNIKSYTGNIVSWTFTWTSPATLTNNNINFYYAALGGDNSGDEIGDNVFLGSFATVLGVLPIELLSFEGSLEGKNVRLDWQTASEKNNASFIVERSADNQTFTPISTLEGARQSDIVRAYQYTDAAPLKGINYYRLKQIDLDGHTTLLKTITVENGKPKTTIMSFHNAANHLELVIHSLESSSATLQLIDSNGRLCYTNTHYLEAGGTHLSMEMPLSTGVYFLRLINEKGETMLKKIIL